MESPEISNALCETIQDEQDDLEEIIQLKLILQELSKNLSQLNGIKIVPKNLELQKIKQDLDTSKSIDSPITFAATSKYILSQVNTYLEKNCNHIYYEDIYDINEDGFKKIKYCKKCYHGFNNN